MFLLSERFHQFRAGVSCGLKVGQRYLWWSVGLSECPRLRLCGAGTRISSRPSLRRRRTRPVSSLLLVYLSVQNKSTRFFVDCFRSFVVV